LFLIFLISNEGNRSLHKAKKEILLVFAFAFEFPESLAGMEWKVYQLLISHIQSKITAKHENNL